MSKKQIHRDQFEGWSDEDKQAFRDEFKRMEDSRDIFEKALAYSPVIGAVAGGALGRKILPKYAGKNNTEKNLKRIRREGTGAGVLFGGAIGANVAGADFIDRAGRAYEETKKKRRK